MSDINTIEWADIPLGTTNNCINLVERELGIRFPSDYRDFALKFAGAKPISKADFDLMINDVCFNAEVGLFLSFNYDDSENVLLCKQEIEDLPDSLVPITSGGGSDCVCFDYQEDNTEPTIVFWKFGLDEPVRFAKNFTDFINLLY
ncbi:SMI1/KNR4 family protein [Chamaesiphon sp. VAR_48_metabat_403]|uniref:SMI1/KNR4 family protein n=1 Tax=Chamaesiphon sp. VAR_48_metabat_403 TaxID=2964700 RepID=UPI00286DD493|nr:SMI1/KNR4 family protein [Chamaesiphon sp. VAR_48_metabat_403]